MYIGLHAKYPLFLSDFNVPLIFCTSIRKTLRYQTLSKSELFHAHRQTGRHDESDSRFSQFRERAWKLLDCKFLIRKDR